MSTLKANPEEVKRDLNSNIPFTSCKGQVQDVSFKKLAAVGNAHLSKSDSSSLYPGGICPQNEAFRNRQSQMQRFLSVDEDDVSSANISTDSLSLIMDKRFDDTDLAMTIPTNTEMSAPNPKAKIKPRADFVESISFKTLATRNKGFPDSSDDDLCFKTQAFRIPQGKRDAFPSIDEEGDDLGDKCSDTEQEEHVVPTFDAPPPGGTVESDVKPSFLNFEG